MYNDDLKRFYQHNAVPERKDDFVRYDSNKRIQSSDGVNADDVATVGQLSKITAGVSFNYVGQWKTNTAYVKDSVVYLDDLDTRIFYLAIADVEASSTLPVDNNNWTKFLETPSGKLPYVFLDVPESATNGTITEDQYQKFDNPSTYILLHDEFYSLADDQSKRGYMVFSHTGEDNLHHFYIKCITLTIETLSWVMTSKRIDSLMDLNYKGQWVTGDEIHNDDVVYYDISSTQRVFYVALNAIQSTTIAPNLDTANWHELFEIPIDVALMTENPTSSTVSNVGQFILNTTNQKLFICVAKAGNVYTYKEVTLS